MQYKRVLQEAYRLPFFMTENDVFWKGWTNGWTERLDNF